MSPRSLAAALRRRAELEKTKAAVTSKHADLVARIKLACPHPVAQVFAVEYRPESLVAYAQPPARVCAQCGYAEEGWGCGWQMLPLESPHSKIERSAFYKLCRGAVLSNSEAFNLKNGRA